MLKRLHVRNFKSLRDVEVSFETMNFLVGPNMGGKSNILDVFRFLYECWFPSPGTSGATNAAVVRGGIDEIFWKGAENRAISFELEASLPGDPCLEFLYSIEFLGATTGFVNIQRERLLLRRNGEPVELIENRPDGRWLVDSDGKAFVNVQPDTSALQHAPPNWGGFPFKWFVQNWRFFQLVPSLMKQPNQSGSGSVLAYNGQNLSAWLMWLQTRAPDCFARINEVAHDVFPDIQRLLTWPNAQGLVTLASMENGLRRPTMVNQMSDGELVFIALLSLIFAPDQDSGTLFFLEEPENHLHPRLVETLFSTLRQGQLEIRDRGTIPSQIIVTTQSPYVVDQTKLDEIVWVQKREGETIVVRPSSKERLRTLVNDHVVGLSDLWFSGALSGDQ